MSESITVISPARWSEALDLLAAPLAEDVRPGQIAAIRAELASDPLQAAGLLGYFRGDQLAAASWLQLQPGHTATLWPPAGARQVDRDVNAELITRSLEVARTAGAVLAQSLLLTDAGDDAEVLRQAGFDHTADLLYLVSLAAAFPVSCPTGSLEYVAGSAANIDRLKGVVEHSYHGTRDCAALNGVRAIEDVLAGYRAIGRIRPELWLIARAPDCDAGCVLLADHAPEPVWELVYMGVVPEKRGRGLGLEITRYAQWLATKENVERLVLAVDAENEPALAVYAAAGFVSWDRRSVFVRLIGR